jgi:hypothetical protein
MATPIVEKPEVTLADDRENDVEKTRQVHMIDNVRVLGLSEEDATFYRSYTTEERRRVIRKVSLLIPLKMSSSLLTSSTLGRCQTHSNAR